MKKIIRHKLLYQNGCAKNFLLIEIGGKLNEYKIIEEFRGRSIARSMLRGIYRNKLRALASFQRIIGLESIAHTPTGRLVFG